MERLKGLKSKRPLLPGQSKFNLNDAKKLADKNKRMENLPDRVSAWFITINGHIDARKLTAKQLEDLRAEENLIAAEVLDKKLNKILVLKEKGGAKKIARVQLWLKNEEQEYNAGHQEHTHALLTINHKTKLHLNYELINKIFLKKYFDSPIFKRIRQEVGLPSGGGENGGVPMVHIKRATTEGLVEREYMEKGTHTIWKRKDVSEYYKNLRATGVQDQELFNRFERTGTYFINPPEGYIPG